MNKPLVSIVINNYNYGRFLGKAIDSALNQTYVHKEVIVVDDGSTDDSREIIAKYGNRIIAVLKENGGQASAFNAGFVVSKGDIIIFLDADDILLPEAVQEVVSIWEPKLSKVQWRLQLVDEKLRLLPDTWPSKWQSMPSGDLRPIILRWRHYPCPPTSGKAFSRWLLERILPMPEEEWRIAADSYLLSLAALYGEVRSIDKVLGYYRIHGRNLWYDEGQNIRKLIQMVKTDDAQKRLLEHAAHNLGLNFEGRLIPLGSKVELALAVLAPQELKALGKSTNRFWIAFNGIRASLVWPYFPNLWARIRLLMWFALVASLPHSLARRLTLFGMFPTARPPWLARLLRVAEKLSPQGGPYG
jgi:glycosyltransferase involved in cell wall biosynthesis